MSLLKKHAPVRNPRSWPVVTALAAAAWTLFLPGCGGGGDDTAQEAQSPAASASEPDTAAQSTAVEPGTVVGDPPVAAEAAQANESPAVLKELGLEALSVQQYSALSSGPPCGLVPGNQWLARAGGSNSDPLNMILCFRNVTWNEVFKGLSDLPGRSFDRAWPLPDVKGPWRRVYDPVDFPLFRGNHCTNGVSAQYGTTAWRTQEFSARENGCGSVLWTGVNHFRLWGSGNSAVLAVSTERPCGLKHCIVSFNGGRDLLAAQLSTVAARLRLNMASSLYDTGHSGSIRQPDGSNVGYDGKVMVIALTR